MFDSVTINYYLKLFKSILKQQESFAKGFSNFNIEEEICKYNCALVHAAISPVKSVASGNPFDYILNKLQTCDDFYIPAFTPSFRKSGVYVEHFSRPEVGAFSNLAFSKNFYRIPDPVHSLFCNNEIEDVSVMNDTFHPDGVYKKFVEKGACWLNFGTPRLVSTVFHYIERYCDAPYLEKDFLKGFDFFNGEFRRIEHVSYKYNRKVVWNRKKIEKDLFLNGCLRKTDIEGFVFRIVDGHLAFEFLKAELDKDPYYMVSL